MKVEAGCCLMLCLTLQCDSETNDTVPLTDYRLRPDHLCLLCYLWAAGGDVAALIPLQTDGTNPSRRLCVCVKSLLLLTLVPWTSCLHVCINVNRLLNYCFFLFILNLFCFSVLLFLMWDSRGFTGVSSSSYKSFVKSVCVLWITHTGKID